VVVHVRARPLPLLVVVPLGALGSIVAVVSQPEVERDGAAALALAALGLLGAPLRLVAAAALVVGLAENALA
jgi:hypothetical protein